MKPIYSGTYQESITKALTAHKSGTPPVTSVLLSTDMFTLIDEDAIVPFDRLHQDRRRQEVARELLPGLHGKQPDRRQDLGHSVPALDHRALLQQGSVQGGRPRSREGADHLGRAAAFAEKLTKRDASGNTTQWGVSIPSSGFPYWLFQGLTTQAGAILANPEGNRTFYDKPEVIEALQYWADLSRKHKVHPPGIVEWGTTPKDFFERKVAMMWTTTGNLTNVKANAKFPFGVAMLPAHKRGGSPTGGGNFYISKKASAAEQAAAFQFITWITTPERAAQWSIDTGYVAVRPDAYETEAMKKYAVEFPPAAVARDQLKFAVAELSTHENQRVTKPFNDGIQAALNGTKTAEQAMKDAQAEAERILRQYR